MGIIDTNKARTAKEAAERIWQHFLNMEIITADDVTTGAPVLPVIAADIRDIIARTIDRCAAVAAGADNPMHAATLLHDLAAAARATKAHKLTIDKEAE